MGLFRRHDHRDPFEFGHDGLGLNSLAHHRVAQRNIDLAGSTHRTEDDATLNPDLDVEGAALHRAFPGGLAEGKLVAQVTCGRSFALRGDVQGRRAGADVDPRTFDLGSRWRGRCGLGYTRLCAREETGDPAAERLVVASADA